MSERSPTLPARVAIVLVNWNGWRECIECVDSLFAQEHQDFHIFIVDNDSRDHSLERIRHWCDDPAADPEWRQQQGVLRHTDRHAGSAIAYRVASNANAPLRAAPDGCKLTLLASGGNLGFAGGCNVGIVAAGSGDFDYFWFVNPDTVVERRALTHLLTRAAGNPRHGILGSTLLFYGQPDLIFAMAGGRLNRSNGAGAHVGQGASATAVPSDPGLVERELSWICGASMLVSAAYVRDVGMMQEDYFLYYEEADWATRGKGRFTLGYAPASIVYHKSGANSSKVMPLFTAGFYYRSRLRFVSRFWPERLLAARRQLFVEMLKHLGKRRWAAARLVGKTLLWSPARSAARLPPG